MVSAKLISFFFSPLFSVTGDNPTEKHPERRLKAAYLAYEEKMLPQLRKEYPGMRHSQLTQMIFKSFQTAPENPKNQAHKQYNEKWITPHLFLPV